MKKLTLVSLLILALLSCRKKEFAAEGPTDIRVRNMSDMNFTEVIVTSSEKTGDTDTLGNIANGNTSDYYRFKKAYPKAEVSAKINIGGTLVKFSTGTVDFTYLTYIGQDKITFEVYISNMDTRELSVSNVILEEPLVLK
jgi:hypothetical protein